MRIRIFTDVYTLGLYCQMG